MKEIKNTVTSFIIKAMTVVALCRIHEYTRYRLCRTIGDLFYWPDGFCLDMVIVFAAIAVAIFAMYDEMIILQHVMSRIEAKAYDR